MPPLIRYGALTTPMIMWRSQTALPAEVYRTTLLSFCTAMNDPVAVCVFVAQIAVEPRYSTKLPSACMTATAPFLPCVWVDHRAVLQRYSTRLLSFCTAKNLTLKPPVRVLHSGVRP